jgi:gamma-glutamyl:cysteine ligase YbdK (ATP-grasp superfamily)
MRDASHLWWAIRPSLKYPTLELRAADSCTRLDDTIAIAALYRVLDLIAPDAEALACAEPVEHCRAIVLEGTSADAQLRIFTENEHQGAEIALHEVSRWIRDATLVA